MANRRELSRQMTMFSIEFGDVWFERKQKACLAYKHS